MAGRGPAPSGRRARPNDQRRDDAEKIVVAPDDEIRGPDLPETFDWPDATKLWWETWRKSPQAQTFTDTDWSFLLDTAMLHAEFWLGDRTVAGELRLRVAKFGATPEDRARLKLSVGTPAAPPVAAPAKASTGSAKARRSRLLKVVGDDD